MPYGKLKPVLVPVMVLTGMTLPLTVLSYAVIELLPALATKIWLLTVSTAMPHGLIKPVLVPVMVLTGVTLPVSVLPYTVTELDPYPKLATKIWLCTVSTAMPVGLPKPVLRSEILLTGVTLPASVILYVVTELFVWFATKI